ncbi:hypothetical protein TNCV_983961 [Trichonephila clavipes]|nr:hypothetical protein TNCV_983961 [Trichonephila clavipes]
MAPWNNLTQDSMSTSLIPIMLQVKNTRIENTQQQGLKQAEEPISDYAVVGLMRSSDSVQVSMFLGVPDTWGCCKQQLLKEGADDVTDPTHSNLIEYDDIAGVLISRFERTVPLSTWFQLFSSCIQGSSESVQEFAARINKLRTQIFQSSNSAQNTAERNANDQLLQFRFISGLRNNIHRFVLAGDPNNLEESINVALIEEQNVKLNQIANEERTDFSPLYTETSVISALTNK